MGLFAAGPTGSHGPGTASAATAPPPLAVTLLTAPDLSAPATPATYVSGTLKQKETLTGLVTRLGAPANEAAAALQTYARARQERTAKIQIGSRGNQWMKTQGNAGWVYGYDAWTVALPAD